MLIRRPIIAFVVFAAIAATAVIIRQAGHPSSPPPVGSGAAEVLALIDDGRPARAEARARELLTPEAIEGRERTRETAELLRLYARAMRLNGKQGDPETRRLSELAVAIAVETAGEPSLEVAEERLDLGILCSVLGNHAGARAEFEQALKQFETLLGPGHPRVAHVQIRLGYLTYQQNDDVESAQRWFARAREIQEATLDPDDLDIAYRLGREANVRSGVGDWDGARSDYERAISIVERRLRPGHPLIALQHHNLGDMLSSLCDWAGAVRHLELALEARRAELGETHVNVAWTMTLLAKVRDHLGEHEEARALWQTSLAVFEKSVGPDAMQLLLPLDSLARGHLASGDLPAAEKEIERAGAILANQGDADPTEFASIELLRADLAAKRGDPDTALEVLRQALAGLAGVPLAERMRGELLEQTGRILGAREDPEALEQSVETLVQALELARREYLPDGLRTIWLQDTLARVLSRAGRHGEAFAHGTEAATIGREHLQATAALLEERRALGDAAHGLPGLPVCLWTAAHDPAPGRAAMAWDALIRSRSVVYVEMLERRRLAALSNDPTTGELARALGEARSRYADLAVRGRADPSQPAWRAQLDDARKRRERAERELAEASVRERASSPPRAVGYAEITAALPPDSALVSFARVEGSGHGAAEYIALVRVPGSEEPLIRALGDAESLDRLVTSALAESRSGLRESEYRKVAGELRERLWDPIESSVAGAQEICVVPDGALVLLDIAALPVGEKEYLIERAPPIHYLTTERDLLPDEAPSGRGLLACGGPAFDAVDPVLVAQASLSRPGMAWTARGTKSLGSGALAEMEFPELPNAGSEAVEVAALWSRLDREADAVVLTGREATEEAFENGARGRAVLHLATHGFFLESAEPPGDTTTRGVVPVSIDPAPATFSLELETDHSLLSGLAFAGANSFSLAGREDGILLAEEICALDLSGVRLAVLSACDTGLGQVQSGEGVFGLRRAFQVAGVRTLVTSLWPVVDETAQARMLDFYGRWLERGESAARALHSSALRVLEERRAHGESTHPFHWAGFLAVGGRG